MAREFKHRFMFFNRSSPLSDSFAGTSSGKFPTMPLTGTIAFYRTISGPQIRHELVRRFGREHLMF